MYLIICQVRGKQRPGPVSYTYDTSADDWWPIGLDFYNFLIWRTTCQWINLPHELYMDRKYEGIDAVFVQHGVEYTSYCQCVV